MNPAVDSAAEHWLTEFGLPEAPLPFRKDLAGRNVLVSRIQGEEHVRFFFPRRGLVFHQGVVKKLMGLLRRRGAEVVRLDITPESYARWIDSKRLEDTPVRRYTYATRPPIQPSVE